MRATVRGRRCSAGVAAAFLVAAGGARATAADWPQFGGDAAHSQVAAGPSAISPSTVGRLERAFQVTLPDVADGAPVYRGSVTTASGVRDVLYVTTHNGTTAALDAHTGQTIWTRQVGPGSCRINNGPAACYTTASPAIDPSGRYVYAYGLDGYVHKYDAGTGTESRSGGWPELATRKPFDEKGSADLSIATARNGATYLYTANGGYPGDQGDYQGHITAVNLATGSQAVFNTLCSNQAVHFARAPATPDCAQPQSAVWARSGVVYDSALDRIFLVTGNGDYSPAAFDWGDSVLALAPDGTAAGGTPLDSWTPANFQSLQDLDLDLGSTAPAILPSVAGSPIADLGVQAGKDGSLRLLDLADLSGRGGPGHTGGEISSTPVPQGGEVLTQPLAWADPATGTTWVIVATGRGLSGSTVRVVGGRPTLSGAWSTGTGAFSPVLANGVVFSVTGQGLLAVNATTGTSLWSDHASTAVHWESPIVVGSRVYYTDGNRHLTAFAIPAEPSTGLVASLSADINGDGFADQIDVFRLGVFGRLSTGHDLGPLMELSSRPFFGSRATVAADVTGDGRADVVAVNDGSVWVLVSSGSGFGAPVLWSSHPFFGSRATVAADVTGDKRADLLAIDAGTTWEMTSTGSSFGAPAEWGTPSSS